MAYSKILIAIDGSQCSMNAVKKGIELAKELSASVIMLSIVDMTSMIENTAVGAIIDTDLETIYREDSSKILQQASKKYPYDKLTLVSEEGIPNRAINAYAEKHEVDLIVMGTHGRTGLDHLFMGSVAEYVIRHSKLPVMVIASQDK